MIAEKKSSAIVAIIWKPLSSDHSDSKNTRMHCIPNSKITKFPLLEDPSNPKSMGSLSFPSSFTLKSTHKYKKTTFKQESTIRSRHVEFDEWHERCVRRRSPRHSFTFSAIVWKGRLVSISQAALQGKPLGSENMVCYGVLVAPWAQTGSLRNGNKSKPHG